MKINRHKLHRIANHAHHIVECIVATAVAVGHHYIEATASGVLGLVVVIVILCDILESHT